MSVFDEVKDVVTDVIENPDAWLGELSKVWEEIDPEDQAFIQAVALSFPSRWLAKKYWLRKGAPEWAAKGFASLGVAISLAQAKYAFEQRKREREAAKKSASKSKLD